MSRLLPTRMVEKPWGMDRLPPPFSAPEGKRIGEIWFEPPAELRELLVKYIFAGEKLSIQTHPSDAQTEAKGLGRQGKEECWLVIAAEPGAKLAIGFKKPVDAETMRRAALDGSIEDMLVWHEVSAGDFFYVPANTVHAIGGGVSLIEIQQNSDITYRLYDYGRPRELHLEDGIAVARGEPYPPEYHRHIPAAGTIALVDGPHFRLDRIDGQRDADLAARYSGPLLVIPLDRALTVAGQSVEAGDCALADALTDIAFAEEGQALITQPV